MKNKKEEHEKKNEFGIQGDYMASGIDILDGNANHFKAASPQLIPGQDNPPAPWDDKKREGKSMGEMLKDQLEEISKK